MSKSLPVIKDEESPVWYSKGLKFKCTECGQCCTGGPGYVWVSETEIETIAQHLKMDLNDFYKRFLRYVKGRYALIEDPRNYDCIFLKNKKCEIYSIRPKQCRTYPWWPDHLKSEKDWLEAAHWCEGINEDAPIVPLKTIQEQLSIQTDS